MLLSETVKMSSVIIRNFMIEYLMFLLETVKGLILLLETVEMSNFIIRN